MCRLTFVGVFSQQPRSRFDGGYGQERSLRENPQDATHAASRGGEDGYRRRMDTGPGVGSSAAAHVAGVVDVAGGSDRGTPEPQSHLRSGRVDQATVGGGGGGSGSAARHDDRLRGVIQHGRDPPLMRHSPTPAQLRPLFGGDQASSGMDIRREGGYVRDASGVMVGATHPRPPPGSSFVDDAARDAAAAGAPVVGAAAARAMTTGQGGLPPRWLISVGRRVEGRARSRTPSPRMSPSPAVGGPVPFEHAVGAVAPRSPVGVRAMPVPEAASSGVVSGGGFVDRGRAMAPTVRDAGHVRMPVANNDWRQLGNGYPSESMAPDGSRARTALPLHRNMENHGPTGVAMDHREISRHRGERGAFDGGVAVGSSATMSMSSSAYGGETTGGVGPDRSADASLSMRLPGRMTREIPGESGEKISGASPDGAKRGAKRPRFFEQTGDHVQMEAAGAATPSMAVAAEGIMSIGATGIVEQRRGRNDSGDSSD